MSPHAALLLPPPALANCLSAAVFRDTVGAGLSPQDRLNYFPANPLYAVTKVFEGQIHMATQLVDVATLQTTPPLPPLSMTPPQSTPISSWSPSGMRALTIAFYPDAWIALGGHQTGSAVPWAVEQALSHDATTPDDVWQNICADLTPLWTAKRPASFASRNWPGSHRLSDWARHITVTAALSGPGQSLRAAERRLRRWTGQSKQALDAFAKTEDLHALRVSNPDLPLAELAAAADFSDQSHMGRAVKRVTGFSPAQLNRRIATEEPFWCYRLMGERF